MENKTKDINDNPDIVKLKTDVVMMTTRMNEHNISLHSLSEIKDKELRKKEQERIKLNKIKMKKELDKLCNDYEKINKKYNNFGLGQRARLLQLKALRRIL